MCGWEFPYRDGTKRCVSADGGLSLFVIVIFIYYERKRSGRKPAVPHLPLDGFGIIC